MVRRYLYAELFVSGFSADVEYVRSVININEVVQIIKSISNDDASAYLAGG